MSEGVNLVEEVDLLVVGGGINGTGIARDAQGRGLSVCLVEQDQLDKLNRPDRPNNGLFMLDESGGRRAAPGFEGVR